jgi:hypothetical protein
MLPAIAFIISAYALFRILSELMQGPAKYPRIGLYIATVILGIISALAIVANCAGIYSSATSSAGHELPQP